MELSVVFNEVCLRYPAPSKEKAREWMHGFVDTLTTADDAGLQILRIHADFKDFILSPDYPMAAWYNDDLVPRERREYLLYYAAHHSVIRPHIADLEEDHSVRKRSDAGFTGGYEGTEALGLSFAYMLNAIAISILTEDVWDSTVIEFDRLEQPTQNELVEDRVSVKHLSRRDHVVYHQPWIGEFYRGLVQDGPSLIKYGKFLYPNIVFCLKAQAQVQAMGPNHYYFDMLRNEIENMQRYCSQWTDSYFDSHQLGGRTNRESEATLNQYGFQRRFFILGRGFEIFSWHTRLDRAWRIHFYPVPPEGKIYIGYIGEHLDTAT